MTGGWVLHSQPRGEPIAHVEESVPQSWTVTTGSYRWVITGLPLEALHAWLASVREQGQESIQVLAMTRGLDGAMPSMPNRMPSFMLDWTGPGGALSTSPTNPAWVAPA